MVLMKIDNGKLSTYIVTILGFVGAVYFMYQGAINGYLTEQGYGYTTTSIAIIFAIIYNLAYPRMEPKYQALLQNILEILQGLNKKQLKE
jgi:hypothetical protein